jgi:predicted nucleic acid-binding Zn ribbon protein
MNQKDQWSSLKEVLEDLFSGTELPFNPDDARIWQIWEDVVGTAIAGKARPDRIRNGYLRVLASDPIWLQELEFAEESIRRKLNDRLGREAVKKITFRLGSE